MYDTELAKAYERIQELEGECERLKAAFKNFHRSLCERFGYSHDEVDWERDQVSLEEHIANRYKPQKEGRDAE